MKIDKEFTLFAKGNFTQSLDFKIIKEEIHSAIQHVVWGSENLFLINPIRKGNGVVPIKKNFVSFLQSKGWLAEQQYKPQNKMFRFYKTFCSRITLINTNQNVILNPI